MEPKTYVDASEHGLYHQIIWKICVYIYIYMMANQYKSMDLELPYFYTTPHVNIYHMWIHRYPNLDALQLIQAS